MFPQFYAWEYFWIDAICIDQANYRERHHQVQQMGSIYRLAQEVVIWLDGQLSGVPLYRFESSVEAFCCLINRSLYPSRTIDDKHTALAVHRCDDYTRCGACQLGSLRYWTRLWIIQEILLAKTITCLLWNGFVVDWQDLFRFFPSCAQTTPAYNHFAVRKSKMKTSEELQGDLGYLLDQYSYAECLDVRDRIYGMLSLADPQGSFLVDYEESCLALACRAALYFPPYLTFFEELCTALAIDSSSLIGKTDPKCVTRVKDPSSLPACETCGVCFFNNNLQPLIHRDQSGWKTSILCLSSSSQQSFPPRHLLLCQANTQLDIVLRCYGPIDNDCRIFKLKDGCTWRALGEKFTTYGSLPYDRADAMRGEVRLVESGKEDPSKLYSFYTEARFDENEFSDSDADDGLLMMGHRRLSRFPTK